MTTRSKVAILRTTPEHVLEDYDRLLDLAEVGRHLQAAAPTILKDNISWHFPFPAANTTPWQMEGTIRALRRHGYDDLICVQNKTVVTDAFKGTDLNGYWPICKEYDVPVLFNFKEEDMHWVPYQSKSELLVLPHIFDEGLHIPAYFAGKNIVHLPTVKCHIYTTTTGAMKNAFGGLLNHHRHYTHSVIHETLVDLLTIQKEIHPGIFAVMDGTTAGNGAGPRIMDPQVKSVILASADQVAIDAVAARIMGFDPMSIKYTRMAHDRGLGCADPREIEIVGDVDAAAENWHFQVGKTFLSFLGWLSWYGPTKRAQRYIFRNPVGEVSTSMISETYHDYYRWNLRDRHIYEAWKLGTEWGALFSRYHEVGTLGDKAMAGVR